MTNNQYLALDLGSTSIKAAVVRARDEVWVATRRWNMPTPVAGLVSGRHETDPRGIVSIVVDAIRQLCEEFPDIKAVGFSTQMHGVILTDKANQPASPFISWQDDRAADLLPDGRTLIESVQSQVSAASIKRTGLNLRPGLGAFNATRWLAENPSAAKVATRIHTLGSFVLTSLCGAFGTHITNAAALGVVDLVTGEWHRGLIEYLNLEYLDFPDINHSFGSIGTIALEDGTTISVHPDIGDHQASLFGAHREEKDMVAISLGTAGIAARIVDKFRPGEGYEVRPHVGGNYINAISRLPGGRHLDTFASVFAAIGRDIFEDKKAIDTSRNWIASAPHDRKPPGHIVQVSERSHNGDLRIALSLPVGDVDVSSDDILSALLQHFGSQYRQAVTKLFGQNGPKGGSLNGGMVLTNPWLSSFFSEALGVPVIGPSHADMALRGLARMIHEGFDNTI